VVKTADVPEALQLDCNRIEEKGQLVRIHSCLDNASDDHSHMRHSPDSDTNFLGLVRREVETHADTIILHDCSSYRLKNP